MVLVERAITELSSLMASVTLRHLLVVIKEGVTGANTHINEFGFFFFFRIAVAVSSGCWGWSVSMPGRVSTVAFRNLQLCSQRPTHH